MEADQPLSTLVKKLHWKYPHTEHDENSYPVTLGTMLTEKMQWGMSDDDRLDGNDLNYNTH